MAFVAFLFIVWRHCRDISNAFASRLQVGISSSAIIKILYTLCVVYLRAFYCNNLTQTQTRDKNIRTDTYTLAAKWRKYVKFPAIACFRLLIRRGREQTHLRKYRTIEWPFYCAVAWRSTAQFRKCACVRWTHNTSIQMVTIGIFAVFQSARKRLQEIRVNMKWTNDIHTDRFQIQTNTAIESVSTVAGHIPKAKDTINKYWFASIVSRVHSLHKLSIRYG